MPSVYFGLLVVLVLILLYCGGCLAARALCAGPRRSAVSAAAAIDTTADAAAKAAAKAAADAAAALTPVGYAEAPYVDHYKWMPVKYNNQPYLPLEAVNLFRRGTPLFVRYHAPPTAADMAGQPAVVPGIMWQNASVKQETPATPWAQVAVITGCLVVNAYPTIVLDRPVDLTGAELAVPVGNMFPMIYPDKVKAPYREIETVSRWVV